MTAWAPLTNLSAIAQAGYTNVIVMDKSQKHSSITGVWSYQDARYERYTKQTKPYWLESDESAAVTERLEKLVGEVEKALPNILSLTNQLGNVLSNSTELTSNLNFVAAAARPALSNLTAATAHLDHPGALGEWLLPTNVNHQLEATLGQADSTLANVNTNISALAESLGRTLDNLASMTAGLNQQVQSNTNILAGISATVTRYDEFIQGLKHHWLLRSAFKSKNTNAPPRQPIQPLRSPKERNR